MARVASRASAVAAIIKSLGPMGRPDPLAVFLDGRGLTDSQMHGLAREMNLSETTFVIPRDPAIERERGGRVRIFTVDEEIPFAGHPTLGTAFALRGPASGSTR